jgi:hypothetical protein
MPTPVRRVISLSPLAATAPPSSSAISTKADRYACQCRCRDYRQSLAMTANSCACPKCVRTKGGPVPCAASWAGERAVVLDMPLFIPFGVSAVGMHFGHIVQLSQGQIVQAVLGCFPPFFVGYGPNRRNFSGKHIFNIAPDDQGEPLNKIVGQGRAVFILAVALCRHA